MENTRDKIVYGMGISFMASGIAVGSITVTLVGLLWIWVASS